MLRNLIRLLPFRGRLERVFMKQRVAVVMLAISLGVASVGQADVVDDFVKVQVRSQKIPGLALVVVKDGKIIKAAGYGFADMQRQTPATAETIYHVGSIGKTFMASTIMLLAKDGRLALDDSIVKHLPEAPPSWKAMTVQHLLSHTSGLPRDAPGFDPFTPKPDADIVRAIWRLQLEFQPGDKWAYSNAAYYLLGEIISRVSGRFWLAYLQDAIIKPLGMNATYPINTPMTLPNRAQGYADNNKLEPVRPWAALHPAGGFLSTALDLAKWNAALDSGTLLDRGLLERMWTPVRLNDGSDGPYGLGWELDTKYGNPRVRHGGSLRGFRSEFVRYPHARLTVIVLMNLDDVDWTVIAEGVAARYLVDVTPTSPR